MDGRQVTKDQTKKIAKAKHEIEMEFKASEGGKNYIAGKKLKYN